MSDFTIPAEIVGVVQHRRARERLIVSRFGGGGAAASGGSAERLRVPPHVRHDAAGSPRPIRGRAAMTSLLTTAELCGLSASAKTPRIGGPLAVNGRPIGSALSIGGVSMRCSPRCAPLNSVESPLPRPRGEAQSEGSIWQLPDGRWRIVYTADGRRPGETYRLKADAEAALNRHVSESQRGVAPLNPRMLLAEYLPAWSRRRGRR